MDLFSLSLELIPIAFLQTLYMTLMSLLFASILGFPLGVCLFLTPSSLTYKTLSLLVNIGRSFPFAILMIALIPLTRWIVGTSLGTTATIVPLSLAATPVIARLVESSFRAIDPHLIRALTWMGATPLILVRKVLLPEALPSLIQGGTLTAIHLVGYSTMAGLIGGGGLGQVAIQYGYHRFNTFVMGITVLGLILLVEILQRTGHFFSTSLLKKRGKLHE